MNGPEYLRIGDAERDETTRSLHEHFVQGRLTREELDERLDSTLSAKTIGDLRGIMHDLPGPATAAAHPAHPEVWAGHRHPARPGRGPWAGPEGGRWGAAPWSRHPARRHRPPPFLPLIAIGLIVAAFAGFGVIKFFVLAWLVLTVLHLGHRWRHRHQWRQPSAGAPGDRPGGRWTSGTGT